jgi:membrane protease subunit HflK
MSAQRNEDAPFRAPRKRNVKKRLAIAAAFALLAYLATGINFVQPDQQVVVRRFGAMLGIPREPGAHFFLPWGWDRVDRIKPREIKRVTIGATVVAGDPVGSTQAQYLTGDRNLVHVRATVHYSIKDPARYLFQTADVDRLVASATEASLSDNLAAQPVDRALTLGKRDLGILLAEKLQTLVDRYELGITIRSVDIGTVEPPAEVADAFDKVVAALREREQMINQAQSFANRTTAQAQGDAQQTLDEGRSHRDRVTRQAQGDAQRFESLLAEYQRAPELTASRLYLETMAKTLPRFRSKLIVDSDSGIDLSIMREDSR